MAWRWSIYTLWAALPEEDVAPWLLAAEDEASWEGDPDRCETAFKAARAKAESDGYVVREATLMIDLDEVTKAFEPAQVDATVEP